jgi:hypothetical protein
VHKYGLLICRYVLGLNLCTRLRVALHDWLAALHCAVLP